MFLPRHCPSHDIHRSFSISFSVCRVSVFCALQSLSYLLLMVGEEEWHLFFFTAQRFRSHLTGVLWVTCLPSGDLNAIHVNLKVPLNIQNDNRYHFILVPSLGYPGAPARGRGTDKASIKWVQKGSWSQADYGAPGSTAVTSARF